MITSGVEGSRGVDTRVKTGLWRLNSEPGRATGLEEKRVGSREWGARAASSSRA